MRLRVAGAANDAQVQNDNLHSDFTRNHVVVDRQPRPGPNFASYVLPRWPCCGASASCLKILLGPSSRTLECCCFASFVMPGCGLLFVVAFSKLLPVCCYHFPLCPRFGPCHLCFYSKLVSIGVFDTRLRPPLRFPAPGLDLACNRIATIPPQYAYRACFKYHRHLQALSQR